MGGRNLNDAAQVRETEERRSKQLRRLFYARFLVMRLQRGKIGNPNTNVETQEF